VRVGDEAQVGDHRSVRVDGIESFRKVREEAQAGDDIGLLLRRLGRDDVKRGDLMSS
jgi:elongation factor Tu